jgi:hypothetical protein
MVFAIDGPTIDVQLSPIMTKPWNKRSMGGIRRAKGISISISLHVELRRKRKGIEILAVILVAFNMNECVRATNQTQRSLNFITNVPVSLQRCIWKSCSVLRVLKDGRQKALVVGHKFIAPFRLTATEPKQMINKPHR